MGSFLLTSTLENRFKLAVHQNVSVTPDRGGEVCIERDAEGIMAVLGDIQHSGTEILGTLCGFKGK